MRVVTTAVFLLVLGCSWAGAQSLPEHFTISLGRDLLALGSLDLGDVDGDGCDDFGFAALDLMGEQRAAVVSGATGLVLFEVHGTGGPAWVREIDPTSQVLTQHVFDFHRLDDVDGDGKAEYAYTRKFVALNTTVLVQPDLVVRSGANHAILATIPLVGFGGITGVHLPVRVASLGDLTGDGVPDLGISGAGNVPFGAGLLTSFIDIVDGLSFTRTNLVQFPGLRLDPGGLFAIGDVDGDSVGDLVASSGATSISANLGGSLSLFSGATGQSLWHVLGAAGDGLGGRALPLGDLDGDGILDIACFVAGADVVGPNTGLVCFLSGASGASLFQILPAPNQDLRALDPAADVNGDGHRDLLVEVGDLTSGNVWREYRSGLDGSLLAGVARDVDAVGDLNADGLGDQIERATGPTGNQVILRAATLAGARRYGAAGGSGSFSYDWVPGTVTPASGNLVLTGAAPFATVVGVVSFQPTVALVPGTGLPWQVSTLAADLHGVFPATADAAGRHLDPLNLDTAIYAGLRVYIQYGIFGSPNGVSNAIEILFGP